MISRLGLRARLTILVTAVFAVALSITAVAALEAVERRLIDDTRASAEAVLSSYLESIYGGVATVGVVAPDEATRFFYLDENGNEITEREYYTTIASGFDGAPVDSIGDDVVAPVPIPDLGSGEVVMGGVAAASDDQFGQVEIDPATGVVATASGDVVVFSVGPVPDGEPHSVDLGDGVVAVAQTVTFGDGARLEVGVSNPLQPVSDSLDTIRQLLWVALPVMIAAIALITWLAASRALRPVQAIIGQADAITATNIHQRVPVHAANDEIRDLATTVNGMLQRLDDARHRQHQLVADASHELRSPVAASRAQLEVAAANPETTDWVATAEAVLAEQEHLGTLIDDLLTLSRLDEAGPDIGADVDLDDLIAVEAARHHGVRTRVADPVRIHGNPALLTRALRNLVDNATRHATDDICITLESRDGVAVIHVDDDGPGIAPERYGDVFERFVRLDEARDRHVGGTGLGLAIARDVARAHHGDIICTAGPLGGARFTLTIAKPRADNVDSARPA